MVFVFSIQEKGEGWFGIFVGLLLEGIKLLPFLEEFALLYGDSWNIVILTVVLKPQVGVVITTKATWT